MRTRLLAASLLCVAAPALAQQAGPIAQGDALRQRFQDARNAGLGTGTPRDHRSFAAYDFDKLEPGQARYYPERYRRDARYYQPVALSRDDRLYRGSGWSFYCRRPDGTTGAVTGIPSRAALENALLKGESRPIAALADAPGSRLAGAVDAGKLICR